MFEQGSEYYFVAHP